MSLKEDKAYEEAKNFEPPKPPEQFDLWKATRKYIYVGVACFVFGLSVAGCYAHSLKMSNKSLFDENRELKKTIKTIEKTPAETVLVPYTVPVYITESVEVSKEAVLVTDAPATETVTETAAETDAPDNEYQVKVLTNPLTKIQPYKVKPAAPAMYTVYWIDVKRSDLASLKSSDFQFFVDYINKEYNTDDNVCFYIRLTDYPDIIFDCPVYDGDFGKSTLYVCQSHYDDVAKCDRAGYTCCQMDISDPDKITLTGYKKDEYNLPLADENEVYSFSEFSESLWSRLTTMHESAEFLFG